MIGIVPARGGSKGIRHKNLMTIEGVPLVILACRRLAPYCTDVIVSTEDPQIAAVTRAHGFGVLERHPDYATDDVSVDSVMSMLYRHFHPDDFGILMHQPTVYSRDPSYMEQFTRGLSDHPRSQLIATVPLRHLVWKADGVPLRNDRPQRQDAPLYPAREIGLRYYGPRTETAQPVNRMLYPTAPIFDIDTPEDLDAARRSGMKVGKVSMRYLVGDQVGHGHWRRIEAIEDEVQHLEVSARHVGFAMDRSSQVIVNDALDTSVEVMAELKRHGARVITLEDLGPGARLADVVINSLYRKSDAPFEVLRPEFRGLPPFEVKEDIERILVTFGGTDPSHYTEQIHSLGIELLGVQWRIVDPPGRPTGLFDYSNIQVLQDPSMAEEMRKADLVITSAGRTIFEAGAVGVPVLCVAQNLREARHAHLGPASGNIFMGIGLDREVVKRNIFLLDSHRLREEMSEAGRQLTDGRGAERIARLIEEML